MNDPTYGRWRGLTLSFIRQVLREPARYPSAHQAMLASHVLFGEPEMGAVCWYEYDSNPYGNVSLYIGDRLCLAIDQGGDPQICGYKHDLLGRYVGWSRNIGPDR